MTRRKLTWGRIVRAEAPGAAELAETERQLAQLDPAQLTAQTIARISDEVAGRFRFRQPRRRSRSFGLLQLLALLLAFASTASVGPKVHWPMAPARLPAASLGDAIDWLADSSSSKSDLQVAMGVVDRHVFKALTTLKLLAGDDGQVGATARKAINMSVRRDPPSP